MYFQPIDHSSESGLLPIPNPVALSEKNVRKRLNKIACERLQEICAENKHRLEKCDGDVQLLSKGIYYPHEYYNALKRTNHLEQIETLKKTDSFYHGYLSSEHFSIDVSLGPMMENCCGSFLLRENVRPSEALKAVREGPSLILCGVICQIARLLAVQEILGTEKFDILFASNSSTPLKLGLYCPISHLLQFVWVEEPIQGASSDISSIKKGDLVKFPNHYLRPLHNSR
jgi:hypothetical protein